MADEEFPSLEAIHKNTEKVNGCLFVGWRDSIPGGNNLNSQVYAKLDNTGGSDNVIGFLQLTLIVRNLATYVQCI